MPAPRLESPENDRLRLIPDEDEPMPDFDNDDSPKPPRASLSDVDEIWVPVKEGNQ